MTASLNAGCCSSAKQRCSSRRSCWPALVWSGRIQYWHVAVLALIYGLGRAIDIPARQSYVTDLVGRSDLANAVALNSMVMNGARIVGPAVAGLLIAAFGVALAFFLNG